MQIRVTKPNTRAGCSVEGVCPFVSCRHHLFLDTSKSGALFSRGRSAFTRVPKRKDFEEWTDGLVDGLMRAEHTCSLDVAEEGAHTVREVAKALGVSLERARQIEVKALMKLRQVVPEETRLSLQEVDQRGGSVDLAPDLSGLPTAAELRAGIERLEACRVAFNASQEADNIRVSSRQVSPQLGKKRSRNPSHNNQKGA